MSTVNHNNTFQFSFPKAHCKYLNSVTLWRLADSQSPSGPLCSSSVLFMVDTQPFIPQTTEYKAHRRINWPTLKSTVLSEHYSFDMWFCYIRIHYVAQDGSRFMAMLSPWRNDMTGMQHHSYACVMGPPPPQNQITTEPVTDANTLGVYWL